MNESIQYKSGGNILIVGKTSVTYSTLFGAVKREYRYDEIAMLEFDFLSNLIIKLLNGKESLPIGLKKATAQECKADIEARIAQSRLSMNLNDSLFVACTLLGGTVATLTSGDKCTVVFGTSDVRFFLDEKLVETYLIQTITELKIDGPGSVTTNGGFTGGGFGLEGAAVGIGAASLLNAITAKSVTNTVLYLAWRGGEVFLHTAVYTPDKLRLLLSKTFAAIQSKTELVIPPDLTSQLERLVAMHAAGILTADEFSIAKSKALDM